jgi:methanogenic corrinoid protein MtbC1
MDAIRTMLEANGFNVGDIGAIGTKNLNYIRAIPKVG